MSLRSIDSGKNRIRRSLVGCIQGPGLGQCGGVNEWVKGVESVCRK